MFGACVPGFWVNSDDAACDFGREETESRRCGLGVRPVLALLALELEVAVVLEEYPLSLPGVFFFVAAPAVRPFGLTRVESDCSSSGAFSQVGCREDRDLEVGETGDMASRKLILVGG